MGASAGANGRDRPRLCPAWSARPPGPFGCACSGPCSATTARRRGATASSRSGTSRRSAIRPVVDAELIELGHRFYADCGVRDVVAQVNSIGDAVCRPAYLERAVGYFSAHADG